MDNPPNNHSFYWNVLIELRKEIIEAQKLRAQIVGFKITFVGTAIGLIVANIDKIPRSLLVLPAFAAIFFDLLIESYSFSIKRIGFYCRKHVEPSIRRTIQLDGSFLLWEEFMAQPTSRQFFSTFGNLGLTFLATSPAIVALLVQPDWMISAPLLIALIAFLTFDIRTYLRVGTIAEFGLEQKKRRKGQWLFRRLKRG